MEANSNANSRLRTPLKTKVRLGPDGIHLFHRTSGANILIEEIVPPRAMWATAPRQVSIALTNACDLSCSYCYAPKTRATLTFDRIISWLDELDNNGTMGVGFGGGEPTLYRRFAELCAHTSRNTGLAVTFTTHGHHLDDALLIALKGNVHFIRVSMDGIGSTYERLRGLPFNALHRRLSAIKKIAPFGFNYVVNSDTFPDIDEAVAFAEKAGASEFLLLPEQPVAREGGITEPIALMLRAWVKRYSGPLRLSVSEKSAEGLPTCNPFTNETGLEAYAHIDAHGVLKQTSFELEGIPIGSKGVLSALTELRYRTHAKI